MMFRKSLQAKLYLAVAILTLGVVLILVGVLALNGSAAMRAQAGKEVAAGLDSAERLLAVTDAIMKERVQASMALLTQGVEALGTASLGESVTVGERQVPDLLLGGQPQANRFELVDRVTAIAGGTATLFVRQGDEFVRVSTNVMREGKRAIGTVLDPNGKAIQAIRADQPFFGQVDILGNPFLTGYAPIHDATGAVIGISYVGYKADLKVLEDGIADSHILKRGLMVLLDDRQRVRMHSRDADPEVVAAMVAGAPAGWVVERRSFAPWGYSVLAAFPESEVTEAVRAQILSVVGIGLGIGAALVLLLGWITGRLVVRPLRDLVGKFAAIGGGDYDQVIDEAREDEVGQALKGLASMQSKLKTDMTEARRVATESLRIRYALDSVASNVMLSMPDGEIVYANPSIIEMFRKAAHEIRSDLPNFDPERLVGSSLDVFDKNPSHQNRMMEVMRSRHEAQITIAGRIFNLIANPIADKDGSRIGTVIEWEDRTEELKIEREVTALVEAAAAGDFSNRVATHDLDGFFKRLGEGINTLVEITARGLGEVARVLDAVSQGDLNQRMDGDYQGTFGQLKDSTNDTVGTLKQLIGQIKESADTINTAAGEIASGNSDLSQRTEEQASSLEETASSMEELTSTVKQNADNARQANLLSSGARDSASRGGEQVKAAVASMQVITASAEKISDIISVIDGIAFQTNILALNAAVEAARAGEQGRGFAVVAAEVRSLAQRSATAAKEIKVLIQEDAQAIATGSERVHAAGESMEEIVNQVKRVSDLIAEISAASDEQTSGIEQVNQAITQMDDVTQQNASLVEEAAAAAESLEEQAQGLARAVSVFRVDGAEGGRTQALAPRPTARTPAAPTPEARASRGAAAPVRMGQKGRAATARATGPAVPAQLQSAEDEWEEF
ncbi:methyl-accepting chemotaxis protein [Thiocystis violacea]|uniref:methyl-accepting chemotaxis protein n=1 Tax=Thiocystis violacea TaxID=13725 RepID=UPI001903A480|nr:methyl-accepting chemotaxis protein [Thiocystis violacea]MBK1722867.1 hypothetical protein [Thiocystis violacea]